MIKAVIFDLGGVLSYPPSLLSTLARRMDATENQIEELYLIGRAEYDDGASQANVDGALAAGWDAHLWVDDANTRAWLVELGILQP